SPPRPRPRIRRRRDRPPRPRVLPRPRTAARALVRFPMHRRSPPRACLRAASRLPVEWMHRGTSSAAPSRNGATEIKYGSARDEERNWRSPFEASPGVLNVRKERPRRGLQLELLVGLATVMATATGVLVLLGLRLQERRVDQTGPLCAQELARFASQYPDLPPGPAGAHWWRLDGKGIARPLGDAPAIDDETRA